LVTAGICLKKVYFACAITGGRGQAAVYRDIVAIVKAEGITILSEAFADQSISAKTGIGMKHGMSAADIWAWDLDWVAEADCIIAEVTTPSLGVGYEIAKAHQWNKPVLALYQRQPDRKLSSMIAGSPNVTVFTYDDVSQTTAAIRDFIKTLS
jgi:hypothetical protein